MTNLSTPVLLTQLIKARVRRSWHLEIAILQELNKRSVPKWRLFLGRFL